MGHRSGTYSSNVYIRDSEIKGIVSDWFAPECNIIRIEAGYEIQDIVTEVGNRVVEIRRNGRQPAQLFIDCHGVYKRNHYVPYCKERSREMTYDAIQALQNTKVYGVYRGGQGFKLGGKTICISDLTYFNPLASMEFKSIVCFACGIIGNDGPNSLDKDQQERVGEIYYYKEDHVGYTELNIDDRFFAPKVSGKIVDEPIRIHDFLFDALRRQDSNLNAHEYINKLTEVCNTPVYAADAAQKYTPGYLNDYGIAISEDDNGVWEGSLFLTTIDASNHIHSQPVCTLGKTNVDYIIR